MTAKPKLSYIFMTQINSKFLFNRGADSGQWTDPGNKFAEKINSIHFESSN